MHMYVLSPVVIPWITVKYFMWYCSRHWLDIQELLLMMCRLGSYLVDCGVILQNPKCQILMYAAPHH